MSIHSSARQLAAPDRVLQFLAVGASGALLDTVLLAALHDNLALPLLESKVLAAEAAIVVMFAVNDHWTFADQAGHTTTLRRLLTSNVVRLAGLVTGTAILLALHSLGVWYVAANAVGLGAGFVVNYAFESIVTWQVLG